MITLIHFLNVLTLVAGHQLRDTYTCTVHEIRGLQCTASTLVKRWWRLLRCYFCRQNISDDGLALRYIWENTYLVNDCEAENLLRPFGSGAGGFMHWPVLLESNGGHEGRQRLRTSGALSPTKIKRIMPHGFFRNKRVSSVVPDHNACFSNCKTCFATNAWGFLSQHFPKCRGKAFLIW